MTLPLTTLMYHYVRPAAELPRAGYGGLATDVFDRQLDEICRNATPVDWPAVAAALEGAGTLPDDAILLTFDDGLADHARYVLPRLVSRGLTGVFFPLARTPRDGLALGHRLHALIAALGSGPARSMIVERLSDSERELHAALEAAALDEHPDDREDAWKRPLQRDLRRAVEPILATLLRDKVGPEDELARALYLQEADLAALVDNGMHLGGHGWAHLWLDFEDVQTVRAELRASTATLSPLQQPPWPFAYPYGGVSPTAANEVERAGFRAAFTTVRPSEGAFMLGRIDGEAIADSDFRISARA